VHQLGNPTTTPEETMGHTLYNKIYLGRGPLYRVRGAHVLRATLVLGVAASAGLGWLALRALR
jgi:hypothetical protein